MKISEHADHTEELFGIRAEDIHKWIDGFFDHENFEAFIAAGVSDNYDPYEHRSYRHCREALEEAFDEFEGKYSKEEIKNIFETHLKDDYEGYIPHRKDFSDGKFHERFHESDNYTKEDTILSEQELSDYFYGTHYKAKDKTSDIMGFILRIVLPIILTYIIFIVTVFTFIIPVYKETIIGRKKEMIKELLSISVNIIDQYRVKVKNRKLTLKDAKKQALLEISRLRYGVEGKDYFWITDMQPVMLMHPYRSDLIGKDLSKYKDHQTKSGKLVFVELVNIVKKEHEGYMQYDWQWMDREKLIAPKLSYVKGIPEWNWIVGTGIYITDVEDEIHTLTDNMIYFFVVLSIVMLGILFFVIMQSRKIEERRLSAEKGLKEAKDRYRALVEASNEGHILIVENENVFSNITAQRLTGYSSEELSSSQIWAKLFPESVLNKNILSHIERIKENSAAATELEAQIKTKSGHLLDVIISSSHIFLSKRNGHVVSFRPIISKKSGSLLFEESGTLNYQDIIREIEGSKNSGHIIRMLNQFTYVIKKIAAKKGEFNTVRYMISHAYDAATRQFIKLAIKKFGEPPAKFSFLSLGSIARSEMTLFSDQDNAIVFEDVPDKDEKRVKRYFLKLAKDVCFKLDQAGYPFCPGGIMAMNPKWCLSMFRWKNQFSNWINSSSPQSLIDINVFFDIKNLYGEPEYAKELLKFIVKLSDKKPEFLLHFSRNAINYKIPSGSTINIKNCLIPIINFSRIYAIKYGIKSPETIIRLEELKLKNVINNDTFESILSVFESFWHFRFYNQLFDHAELRAVNDEIIISNLSKEDAKKLKENISYLSNLQSRLSFDFLGMDLS